ncbi:uncharacterized protein C18orf19 homolog A [Stomoxys calcitrans]|uniref:uncharacterized protein C18orf19 homolog A n=1 Tax=Stomoxys calcitrans TaxID=35570 RepID=UPI0027E2D5CE|nr:uncharacterized protein C18orf19 homolog A [Stomoxys calcitrans]
MNTLRFLTNAVRGSNNTIVYLQKQLLKQEHLKRAAHNYAATAAIFIRNTNAGNSSKRRWECNLLPLNTFFPQNQICSTIITSKFHSIASASRRNLSTKKCPDHTNKSDTKSAVAATESANDDIFGEASKLGLFAKFKLMYKMYWYVLIPVHVVTSAGWLVGFYYLSQSGVDVAAVLQYLHLSETIIEKVQGSSLGHWAIAYLCYKVATPLRYAITLGGTTVSIKYLVQQGYIKPMPTKAQFIQMYEDKKAQRAADKASKDNASTSSNPPQHSQEQK